MSDYQTVTIEGTLTPAAGVLPRGEQKTVALTERIRRLVAGGFVKIVEVHDDDEPVAEVEPTNEQGGEQLIVPEQVDPPKRNASRDDWAEYLAEHTPIVTEGKDREQLISEWDQLNEPKTDGDE